MWRIFCKDRKTDARPLELRFRIVYIIYTHVFIFFVLGEQIMTDYQKMYQEKLTTPDKIAQQVQSGWLLDVYKRQL